MIVERMETVDNYVSFSNVSPFFRELLRPKLPDTLFPAVFPILVKTIFKPDESETRIDPALVNQLLKLRPVSKTWCQSVDHYLESKVYMENFHFDPINTSKFLKFFKPTHENTSTRNPFIGRRVSVYEQQRSLDERNLQVGLSQHTRKLFSLYGNHIWYLSCFSFGPIYGYIPNLEDMMSLLQFTPNLVNLNLVLMIGNEQNRDFSKIEIPKLEKLESINCAEMNHQVFNQLVQNNSHISRLTCGPNLFANLDLATIKFSSLQQLRIENCNEAQFLRLDKEGLADNLKALIVSFQDTELENPEKIFTLINKKWSKSLTLLVVKFPEFRDNNFEKLPDLKLEALEVLDISVANYFGLDFIRPLQNTLITFGINFLIPAYTTQATSRARMDRILGSNNEIQPLGFVGTPRTSNIWQVMPNLQKLHFADSGSFEPRIGKYSRPG